ncbi:ribonuclease P protein subunit p30-like isoform X2 [Liolophura sinensis]|uniref:ribonuclease P protein subunit p30-like isoform X2 n=1 Tax=Liolophura sinensis TaxID=3198878 RepID=UPI003158B26C
MGVFESGCVGAKSAQVEAYFNIALVAPCSKFGEVWSKNFVNEQWPCVTLLFQCIILGEEEHKNKISNGKCNRSLREQDFHSPFLQVGYQVVAINYDGGELKGKKGKEPPIKSPAEVVLDEKNMTELKKTTGKSFRQLSRFTTVINDPAQTHKLTSPEIQAYDLLAVVPTSEKTFHLACGTLEVDIISLDLTEKLPFLFRRPSISLAIERGIHFEIIYSPCIMDSTCRRNTISNALALMTICKGKNIIISSGCKKGIALRGPYDVANLGLLFGLTQAQAKDALSKNCRAVLFHAESRKAEKSTISVVKASTLPLKSKVFPEVDDSEPECKKSKIGVTL